MSSDVERARVIRDVVELRASLPELAARLRTFPWDYEHELVVVQSEHLASVARRYIAGELSASEVEEWADLIECRDDVGFGSDDLKETVHRLANQAIDGALTRAMAKAIFDHYDGTV